MVARDGTHQSLQDGTTMDMYPIGTVITGANGCSNFRVPGLEYLDGFGAGFGAGFEAGFGLNERPLPNSKRTFWIRC